MPTKYLDKFRAFEKTGKLNIVVFILFLIPGLPKDTFTYLVPLTDMNMRTFLLLSNIGRIPGILVSTYAADGLIDGRFAERAILFAPRQVGMLPAVRDRARVSKHTATETLTMVYSGQRHGDGLPSGPYGRIPWRYYLKNHTIREACYEPQRTEQ